MRRKNIRLTVLFIVVSAILACEKTSASNPQVVLEKYLDARLNGNFIEMYSYVSAEDKAAKNLEMFLKENEEFKTNPIIQAAIGSIKYKIIKLETSENRCTANVETSIPNFSAIISDSMESMLLSGDHEGTEKELKNIFKKTLETKEIPVETHEETIQLIRENDRWKVVENWKAEKFAIEKREKIRALLAEAEELKKSKKPHGAVQKYEEVLQLDSEMVEAKEGLKETQKDIKAFEEKQAYVEKIELRDFRVSIGQRFGERKKGIFGTIINKGDKTLKKIKITVYFLDKNETIIGEEDFYPVLVTEFSIGDNKPLKPNYVKDFGYSVEKDAPSLWGGKVKGKITDIEFSD